MFGNVAILHKYVTFIMIKVKNIQATVYTLLCSHSIENEFYIYSIKVYLTLFRL